MADAAPRMNFNTTNNTFRQLMGNGLSYRVPSFQRDYSWGADEWDDLWQDVVGLFGEDPEPAHYMGYLVLQSADNREFDVIDGQQRMTWKQFDDGRRDAFTYRLGNLALLGTTANRGLGNAGFDEKRPVLQASEFLATGKLAQDHDVWTVDTIRERQKWMARQATGIWQIQF